MSALFSVKDLSVRFGGLLAVENLSFEVREGEVLALIGPNGAGKTSAFNAITGYLRPVAGEVLFENRNITGKTSSEIAALGLVRTFQKTSVFGGRSALENILIGLHLRSKQTVLAILLGLLPLMWSQGAGADVMKRIAAPMVGGVVSSFVLELLVYPAVYAWWKGRRLPEAPEPEPVRALVHSQ